MEDKVTDNMAQASDPVMETPLHAQENTKAKGVENDNDTSPGMSSREVSGKDSSSDTRAETSLLAALFRLSA